MKAKNDTIQLSEYHKQGSNTYRSTVRNDSASDMIVDGGPLSGVFDIRENVQIPFYQA